jgi:probable F420-dependent oxidoreductase
MRFSTSLAMLRDPSDPDPFRQSFELARIAEEAGFDTLTIGHHHFMPGNASDPLTLLGAVAARTRSIRIGTGIFQLPIHNPVRVAEQLATVDQLSGGRVTLGVGTGWWPLEYEVHGSSYRERGARTEEALEILRLVLGQENTAYQGRFYRFPELTVYPRPVQTPRPPLWVAGVVDAAVDRAARLGDAWLCGPVQSLAKAKACLSVYEASCRRIGREPDWVLRRFAWIGSDRSQVMDEVLPRYVEGLLTHWRESVEDEAEKALFERLDRGERVSPEEIASDRLLFGTPDDIIGQIQRFQRETGATHVHAAFGAGMPARDSELSTLGEFEEQAEMIRLFGREVIPAFRGS